MTVLSEINKITYIGSLAQTLYPIPFEYVNTDNIKVSVYTSNDEFVEDWTFSTQYVIEGGNVKVLPGYEIDDTKKLLVLRSLDIVQDNKYREGGDFPAKSTELSFDKLTMIAQQHQEVLDRCVKVEVVGKQSPKELLDEVYSKLDSATEIAGDAISAANQAQTAADNATAAVNSAEQTLVQTQAYVDSAKVEINNTKNTAINTINSTVTQAKADVNSAIDEATMNISNIVSDAEGSITNIAVTEANKAIANAAQEATDTAKANLNSYVDGTVKPSLQTYVDQAQEDANSAAASMEQAALSATAASNYASNASADADNAAESAGLAANSAIWAEGTDSEVQALGGVHSSKGWSETAQAVVDGKQDIATAVNYTNITNCITEIPQDIKLELVDGTLTLKAGSKVIVPNGAGVFDEVTIASDIAMNSGSASGTEFVYVTANGDSVYHYLDNSSGTDWTATSQYQCRYNTNDNMIKNTNDTGSTWLSQLSFPIAKVKLSSGTVTSIDQVFNGFGYIGSTVFALPGVKGLIPNGRNADGSLRNTEFTTTHILTFNNPGSLNELTMLIGASGLAEGYTQYNGNTNFVEDSTGNISFIEFGKVSRQDSRIISLTPKTAFHAVDYNDIVDTANITDNSSNIATTAWVRNNMQVVSTLPASPVSGVFYFVKE